MTESDADKHEEERKRDAALSRDRLRRWIEVQRSLSELENALPADRRRNTPRASKLKEDKINASMQG
jgi:hypothetical protein